MLPFAFQKGTMEVQEIKEIIRSLGAKNIN
jgi:hypothetical protein